MEHMGCDKGQGQVMVMDRYTKWNLRDINNNEYLNIKNKLSCFACAKIMLLFLFRPIYVFRGFTPHQ